MLFCQPKTTTLVAIIVCCQYSSAVPNAAVPNVLTMHTQVVEDDAPLPSCKHHSPEFVDLIKQCLEKDPYRRPTAETLIAHPFLQKVACAVVPSPLPAVACTYFTVFLSVSVSCGTDQLHHASFLY